MNDQRPNITGAARRYRGSLAAVAFAASVVSALSASCAGLDDSVVLATPDDDGGSSPQLGRPDAGETADADAAPEALRCIGTECPFPYDTCAPSEPSAKPAFKCQNNLLTDNANCGVCGNQCPVYPEFGMLGRCSNGLCEPQCEGHRRDCNKIADDGCETMVLSDVKNCGACGNDCGPGVRCFDGVCGCPPGKTDCGGWCVDTTIDDGNCGACNNYCEPPQDEPPPNMHYGCSNSQCGQLVCNGTWANCNGDLEDGCEVDVAVEIAPGLLDPENCGACGNKCAPGEECRVLADGRGTIACRCPGGKSMCGFPGNYTCVDMSTDPKHCGLCNHACPFENLRGKHQIATCSKGICGTECEPGWGDCNDNPADGCETNTTYDGANCGACGNRCQSGAGQPCVDGRCLMIDCDAGEPVTR